MDLGCRIEGRGSKELPGAIIPPPPLITKTRRIG